jgi:hypothetical protein
MGFVHMIGRLRAGGVVEFKVDSGINCAASEALHSWRSNDASRVDPG